MEPMTLGSPSGSPAPNSYLPSFLMGDTTHSPQTTPRNNTLSPNKGVGSRNISFANSPCPTSPTDYNRSALGQKTLFGGYQQTPPTTGGGFSGNFPGTPVQTHHNVSISGPPTQGLFDSLRSERNQVQTPSRGVNSSVGMPQTSNFGTPIPPAPTHNVSAYGLNQSYHQQQLQLQQTGAYNDSYLSNVSSFNTSRATGMASPLCPVNPGGVGGTSSLNTSHMMPQYAPAALSPRYTEFWVTVYGFPPSATSTILEHFSQCGTIVDKVFPSQNGNWVHLKYSSRLECDKALNYNERVLGNNIMIGVTQCKDRNIVDKENLCDNGVTQTSKVRPLAQTAYRSAQNDSAVVASPCAPQKSSGLMNKAMDLFFGW